MDDLSSLSQRLLTLSSHCIMFSKDSTLKAPFFPSSDLIASLNPRTLLRRLSDNNRNRCRPSEHAQHREYHHRYQPAFATACVLGAHVLIALVAEDSHLDVDYVDLSRVKDGCNGRLVRG